VAARYWPIPFWWGLLFSAVRSRSKG
jgi:hypothetical protein